MAANASMEKRLVTALDMFTSLKSQHIIKDSPEDATVHRGCSEGVTTHRGCSEDVTIQGGGSEDAASHRGCPEDVTSHSGLSKNTAYSGLSEDVTLHRGCSEGVTTHGGRSENVTSHTGRSEDATMHRCCSEGVTTYRGRPEDVTIHRGHSEDPTTHSTQTRKIDCSDDDLVPSFGPESPVYNFPTLQSRRPADSTTQHHSTSLHNNELRKTDCSDDDIVPSSGSESLAYHFPTLQSWWPAESTQQHCTSPHKNELRKSCDTEEFGGHDDDGDSQLSANKVFLSSPSSDEWLPSAVHMTQLQIRTVFLRHRNGADCRRLLKYAAAQILFLHFNDNAGLPARGDPDYDRLYNIRPVVDYLFAKFQEVYEPRQAVCVDKSLLLWKGRLIFRQYIPLKHARFGIKIYLCCESDGEVKGSGRYCYRLKVYAGREDPVNEIQPVLEAVGADNPDLT
ncbi:hypothetical protein BaRGS_00014366 [Batillaria attramentaria]|uniref:PiggyBac transposable element-derived protein domain-containing protein n=1 Tax=Batillaria attramentaria TaxID=370345 RepID=A0ABD0L4J9_9CAEN